MLNLESQRAQEIQLILENPNLIRQWREAKYEKIMRELEEKRAAEVLEALKEIENRWKR